MSTLAAAAPAARPDPRTLQVLEAGLRAAPVRAALALLGDAAPLEWEGALPAPILEQGLDEGTLGARQALALYEDHKAGAMGLAELDAEQGRRVVARALALARLGWSLAPGSPAERARVLLDTTAGRAMLAWVAAVDLALALGSALEPLGARPMTEQIDLYLDEALDGADLRGVEAHGVLGVLEALLPSLDAVGRRVAAELEALAEALRGSLPPVPDRLEAEGAALPVLGLLGARLAEELLRAGRGDLARVEADLARAEGGLVRARTRLAALEARGQELRAARSRAQDAAQAEADPTDLFEAEVALAEAEEAMDRQGEARAQAEVDRAEAALRHERLRAEAEVHRDQEAALQEEIGRLRRRLADVDLLLGDARAAAARHLPQAFPPGPPARASAVEEVLVELDESEDDAVSDTVTLPGLPVAPPLPRTPALPRPLRPSLGAAALLEQIRASKGQASTPPQVRMPAPTFPLALDRMVETAATTVWTAEERQRHQEETEAAEAPWGQPEKPG